MSDHDILDYVEYQFSDGNLLKDAFTLEKY